MVLLTLLADPDTELYGLAIAGRAGVLPGTTYPMLARLLRAGWVRGRCEDIDAHDQRRPRRRYDRLTPGGAAAARHALACATPGLTRINGALVAIEPDADPASVLAA